MRPQVLPCPGREPLIPTASAPLQIRFALQLLLQKSNGGDRGDLDLFPALGIQAAHHIIEANHVAAHAGESAAVFVAGALRQQLFLQASAPAELIFADLPARGTVDSCDYNRILFVEELIFSHPVILAPERAPALRQSCRRAHRPCRNRP